MTETPRPPEGPDQEALLDRIMDALYPLDNYWRNEPETTHRIALAVLPLLLPTPPAPEGFCTCDGPGSDMARTCGRSSHRVPTPPAPGDTPTDAEVAAALRILAPGDDDNVTLGEIRADLAAPGGGNAWENVAREAVLAARTEVAPGDREGLRAEVERLLARVEQEPGPVGAAAHAAGLGAVLSRGWVAGSLRAALAARDTDQGVRDALAEVRGLCDRADRDPFPSTNGLLHTKQIRSALARATHEAGEGK